MANQYASTLNAAAGILKNWYEAPIVSQFNDLVPFWKAMSKGSEKYNGQQVIRPLKVRPNTGIGATSDGGALPAIGFQTTVQAQISAKYNYLRAGITGPMLVASQGDKGSFISDMEYEMTQGVLDLSRDMNRQVSWSGTGKLATINAAAIATNVITATGRESTEDGNKFLTIGMVIDIVDSTGTVLKAQGLSITNLTGSSTVTLTLSGNVTIAANDYIIRSGSLGNELQGILYTMDGGTTTIYNVDRSVYPAYQGNAISNSGGVLTLDFMQRLYNDARRQSGKVVDIGWYDFTTDRMYQKLLVANKRFINKTTGDGSFSSKEQQYIDFAGIPMIADPYFPTRIFFGSLSTWKKYILGKELQWADETGSYMIATTGQDTFEMRLREFANMFCEMPNANSVGSSYISP